ncbi:UPF0147 family protein [Candidatus Woesearchaeota archaeon]|nr:UPF0147 family protein [Candidatus Woesearchaeota archaeon]
MEEEISGIVEVIHELLEDNTVPKNVKSKLETIIDILKEDLELSIRINKALTEIEEVADDTNLQSYTRTQIWNLVSMLEMLGNGN